MIATFLGAQGEPIREIEVCCPARPLARRDLVPILREAMLCRANAIRLDRPWTGSASLNSGELLALCRLAAGAFRAGIGPVTLRREREGLGLIEVGVQIGRSGSAPWSIGSTEEGFAVARRLPTPPVVTASEVGRFRELCVSALGLGLGRVSYRLAGESGRWMELILALEPVQHMQPSRFLPDPLL
jgi:hypothetical protein